MPAEASEYLWINKTQSSASLTSSSGRELALINGHAQTFSAKRRKERHAQPIPSKFRHLQFKHKSCCKHSETSSEDQKASNETSHLVIPHSGEDPFKVTTLEVDLHSKRLLSFHVEWWRSVASNWRVWHEVDLKQSADAVMCHKCFGSPLYMLTTITFTSMQMQVLKLPGSQPGITDVLHLKTLLALREAISTGEYSSMHILEVLSFLCLTEVFKRDFPAVKIHLGAVSHLLVAVGGIGKVLNYASEMIVFCDYYLAFSTLAQPVLGYRVNSMDEPPVPSCEDREESYNSIMGSDWVRQLPERVLSWAVEQIVSCTEILQQAWSDRGFTINGYWVRKKCVSIIICLLDAWRLDNRPSDEAENARITILLWTAFVLATTLDTQGAKNYITEFERLAIERYEEAGLSDIALALKKWNRVLRHDFGHVPPGYDVILSILLKVPSEVEKASGVSLSGLMEAFTATECRRRLAKATTFTQKEAEHAVKYRLWRTSILLC